MSSAAASPTRELHTDLLDRVRTLELLPISDGARRTEAEFWRTFYEARPQLPGALCNAVATARRIERTPRDKSPDPISWIS